MPRFKNAYSRWTDEENKIVAKMRFEGKTYKQISKRLGRSEIAVMNHWLSVKDKYEVKKITSPEFFETQINASEMAIEPSTHPLFDIQVIINGNPVELKEGSFLVLEDFSLSIN